MGETQSAHDQVAVTVAIATYRRPELLAGVLPRVLAQVGGLTQVDGPARVDGLEARCDVVVVDNDPAGSARPVVEALADPRVRYVSEPHPGLAAARNAAIDAAADSRLLVFIDDDGLPEPGWLSRLVATWRTYGADAVAGPAVRQVPPGAEPWVTASEFFVRTPRTTGTEVRGAGTGNLLLDLESLRRLGLRFDERFGLTGGEDTMLTRSLTARGGSLRWCEEAVVGDPVPPGRATRAWVLKREYRMASTWSRVHLAIARPGRARALEVLTLTRAGLGLVARGAGRLAAGTVRRSLRTRAHGERDLAKGRGVIAGLVGRHVEEYGRGGRAARRRAATA